MLSPENSSESHPERKLARRVSGSAPDLELAVAHGHNVPLVDRAVDLAFGHLDRNILGVDPRVSHDLVPLFERDDALGVGVDLALEQVPGPSQTLGVVGVGVGGQDHLAGGQAEIHLPDQFQDVGELVEEADVDQGVFGPAVDQINVNPQAPSGLDIHLDHPRKNVATLNHARTLLRMGCDATLRSLERPVDLSRVDPIGLGDV